MQDDLAELEARAAETAERPAEEGLAVGSSGHSTAAAEREPAANGAGNSEEEDEEGEDEGSDPFAGMTAMQKKMYELKQKMRVGQKANQHAVIAERKRENVCTHACANICTT